MPSLDRLRLSLLCRRHFAALAFTLGIIGTSCVATAADYIKGVTYFGKSWPVAFWNSDQRESDADFKQIRGDGFNTLILVVPWGEFQPGLSPVRFNDAAYARLGKLCQNAKSNGLDVMLRVSYLWDFQPNVQMPNHERSNALLANDKLLPAWRLYLQRIAQATSNCASTSFISWEDFWPIIQWVAAKHTPEDAVNVSKLIGFDSWVRKSNARDFLANNAALAKKLGAYPIPSRDDPSFRLMFQWFDEQLSLRLLPELAHLFGSASIEARIDDDPIYENGKVREWYSHKQTYQVNSSSLLMSYWAPAMGAENHGQLDPASKVLERFIHMQKKVRTDSKNQIFIEQFLFTDNTPSAKQNAQIAPEQISTFLKDVTEPMLRHTAGYALWGARDYDADMLFNGSFALGSEGWTLMPGALLRRAAGGHEIHLKQGAGINQKQPAIRCHFCATAKSTTLRLRVRGPGMISGTYASSTRTHRLKTGDQTVIMEFPVIANDTELTIKSEIGSISLTDVKLYDFTQRFGVRDANGSPGPYLTDIQALNHRLTTASASNSSTPK